MIGLVEKPLLRAVLRETGGNQVRAAQILGINRNTLRKKLTEHGIDPDSLMGGSGAPSQRARRRRAVVALGRNGLEVSPRTSRTGSTPRATRAR